MTDDTPQERGIEQFDLTLGMQFDITPDEINELAHGLEQADVFDAEDADSETLAEFGAALKRLEDAAEDARKETFEDELADRVDDGESVGPLTKQSGRNTWVADTEAAFAAVADAGEDPMDVASVSISGLRDVLGGQADEYIGESSYSYFRRNQ